MNVTAALLICTLAVSYVYLLSGVNAETGTCAYTATKYHTTYYKTKCGWWKRCTKTRRSSYTVTASSSCVWGKWTCGDCKCYCSGGGQGNLKWTRTCTAANCNTKATDYAGCKTCVRNGGWSGWGPDTCTQCYQKYNGGTQICSHERECTNPKPANGGATCVGDHSLTHSKPC